MHSQAEKALYRTFCSQDKSIPIYMTPDWLDAICGTDNWDVIIIKKSDHIEAVFPYCMTTKYGLKVISLPPLTQYLGVKFFYPKQGLKQERKIAFENRISDEIISRLPKHHLFNINFSPDYKNWLAFMWKGFKQSVRYTYKIDTNSIEDDLWAAIKSKTKNTIRKAENNFSISESKNIGELIKLNHQTFERQSTEVPYDTTLIKNIYNTFSTKNQATIHIAKNKDNESVAAVMAVEDANHSYCLFIGSNEQARKNGAVSLLLWQAIKQAKSKKLKFDFEGSNMKNIEPFFRSFGGDQIPYYNIRRVSNRFLEALLILTNKI